MEYQIIGGNMPAAVVKLRAGQGVFCESGAMSWMTDGIEMRTEGGGAGKILGRMFSGDSLFRNHYVAKQDGEIAFASSFPGAIRVYELNGNSIIAQKGSFLASDEGVEMGVFFQKKAASGFFSGEGFVMQKFSGNGTVLIEVDGSIVEYELAAGQRMVMESGYLVAMDSTCSIDVQMVKGVKNVLFGGEGLFNTVVTGPGKIVMQTMPVKKTAELVASMVTAVKSS